MSHRSRRLTVAVAAALLMTALVAFAVVSDAAAKTQKPIDPNDCGTCQPAYVGPNGGICEPLGCVRPGGPCIYGGDCY